MSLPSKPPSAAPRRTRHASNASQLSFSSTFDLPSSSTLAALSPSRSRSRSDAYRGGAGLERAFSAVSVRGREAVICEGGETPGIINTEEKTGVEGGGPGDGAGGEGVEGRGESEAEREERMFARFSDRRKSSIVAIVAYVPLSTSPLTGRD